LPIQPAWGEDLLHEPDCEAIDDVKNSDLLLEFSEVKQSFQEYLSVDALSVLMHPEERKMFEEVKQISDEHLFTLKAKVASKAADKKKKMKNKVFTKAMLKSLQDKLPAKSWFELFNDNIPTVKGKKRKQSTEAEKEKHKLKFSAKLKQKLKNQKLHLFLLHQQKHQYQKLKHLLHLLISLLVLKFQMN
jgi:hypothetical protein